MKERAKNPAAMSLGSLGGKAAAKSLNAKERQERARKGGLARALKAKKADSVSHGSKSVAASFSPKPKNKNLVKLKSVKSN